MADLATHLDNIAANSTGAVAQANAIGDASSPATLFGRRASTSSLLTWGFYGGGYVQVSGVLTQIANGTRQMMPSRTMFMEAGPVQIAPAGTVTGITVANPCVVTTAAAHGLAVGDVVWLVSINGMTQINESWSRVTAVTATTLTLDMSSLGMSAWTSGGTVHRMSDAGTNWTMALGRSFGPAFVAPFPCYQVTTDATAATGYLDYRNSWTVRGGFSTASVAGAVNVVATAAQARSEMIDLTGAITANLSYLLPRVVARYVIRNSTTGAFTLTVATPGGTGIVVAAGAVRDLLCDGVNIVAPT